MKISINLESLADVNTLEQNLPSLRAVFIKAAPNKLPKQAKGIPTQEYLALPISELRVSRRALNALNYGEIETIQDVTNKTEAELLILPNFGINCLNQVKARLQESGLTLKTI